jgi:hypothetical protein
MVNESRIDGGGEKAFEVDLSDSKRFDVILIALRHIGISRKSVSATSTASSTEPSHLNPSPILSRYVTVVLIRFSVFLVEVHGDIDSKSRR